MPVAGIVVAWVPLVLGLDSISGRSGQLLLGLLSWVLLAVLLRRQDPLTRVSVLIVVAYATLIEYTFSAMLGTYTYRLPGVPAFVPPGHGLVYLAALCLGRSRALPGEAAGARRRCLGGGRGVRAVGTAALAAAGRARRAVGRLPAVVPVAGAGAAGLRRRVLVVTYLEILGTSIGTWTWGAHDPVLHWIAIGNPPSGAAGGYGFFDAAALALAPRVLTLLRRVRPLPPEPALELELTEAA